MPGRVPHSGANIGANCLSKLRGEALALPRDAGNMNDEAHAHLWASLGIEQEYEAADISSAQNDREEFLWEELLEAAREDGNLLSFFIVNEARRPGRARCSLRAQ
jgi:hypothetical protein